MKQINLRVPEELLARIDVAAGDVPRERWLRRAVEQALGSTGSDDVAPPRSIPAPAPAEQRGAFVRAVEAEVAASMAARDAEEARIVGGRYRQHVPGPDVENVRSSGQAKRDVRPVPKKGA